MNKSSFMQIIPRKFLFNLILGCVLIFTAGILLIQFGFYFFFSQDAAHSYGQSFQIFSQLRQDIFLKSAVISAAVLFWVAGGIMVLSLLYSHRVMGPMYRLTRVVQRLAAGDFQHDAVNLREKDVVQPLADELNALVENYRGKIRSLEARIVAIQKHLNSDGEGNSTAECRRAVEEIEIILKQIKSS